MTREEKTEKLIKKMADDMMKDREWLEWNILSGRVGLKDYTDEEIDNEYKIWCDGGIDGEIDARALAHEAATNSE